MVFLGPRGNFPPGKKGWELGKLMSGSKSSGKTWEMHVVMKNPPISKRIWLWKKIIFVGIVGFFGKKRGKDFVYLKGGVFPRVGSN